MARSRLLLPVLVYLGIVLAFVSYTRLNVAPGPDRWPAVYAWDPASGELVQPLQQPAYQTFVLESWLDAEMPFVPVLAVPYLSYLLIVPIVVPALCLVAGRRKAFLTVGAALIVSQLVLDVGYFLFQTEVPRTTVPPDGLFGTLVELVRGNDLPFNGFPSAHCAWTTVALVALWRLRRRFPRLCWPLMAWLLLVFPATVMLQQHFLIDVYAGVFIGFACYWAVMFVVEKPVLTLPEPT